MVGELINMDGLGTALVYIADKIGITVAQMYDIYLKAQSTMALLQIAMIIVCVVTLVGIAIIAHILIKKTNTTTDIVDLVIIPTFIGIIGCIIVVFICGALYNPLLAYMCPEYTALKSLMSDIINVANLVK